MSVFTEQCFLFLRAPDGGVEDLQGMKAAGFGGVFCNIKDYSPERWEEAVRPRALNAGMFCGPWARTADDRTGQFDYTMLDRIVYCAEDWGSPLIVNSESELKGSGSELTKEIAATIVGKEAAVSMEPIPFANVDWSPLADVPILPQCFGPDFADAKAVADLWHDYGVKCVFPTFGTYSGWQPNLYPLIAPFSLYTGDDCGNDFKRWSPTGTGFVGCVDQPTPPNGGGGVPTKIGNQDGIKASVNALRDLDPTKTLLVKDPASGWPDLSTLPSDLGKWKAWDKLQRTLQILKDDHDAGQTVFDSPFDDEPVEADESD